MPARTPSGASCLDCILGALGLQKVQDKAFSAANVLGAFQPSHPTCTALLQLCSPGPYFQAFSNFLLSSSYAAHFQDGQPLQVYPRLSHRGWASPGHHHLRLDQGGHQGRHRQRRRQEGATLGALERSAPLIGPRLRSPFDRLLISLRAGCRGWWPAHPGCR